MSFMVLFASLLAMQIFGPGSETPIQVSGYSVTPGYDMATGLGSPVTERFVEDIAQARVSQARRLLP